MANSEEKFRIAGGGTGCGAGAVFTAEPQPKSEIATKEHKGHKERQNHRGKIMGKKPSGVFAQKIVVGLSFVGR